MNSSADSAGLNQSANLSQQQQHHHEQQQQQQQHQQQQLHQIVGASGPQKILKTKVKICGRFLLEPGEEFNAELAKQLVHRCTSEHKKQLPTTLKVFNLGVRLGETGVFASMPVEFIRYQQIVGFAAEESERRSLALCVRSREQRSVTVVQFKDAKALAVVCDVIDKQRRLVGDDPGGSDIEVDQNWTLSNVSSDLQQQQQQHQQHQQQQHQTMTASVHLHDFHHDDEEEEDLEAENAEMEAAVFDEYAVVTKQKVINVTNSRITSDSSSSGGGGGGGDKRMIESVILNYDEIEPDKRQLETVTMHQHQQHQQQHQQQQHNQHHTRVVTSISSGSSKQLERPAQLRIDTRQQQQQQQQQQFRTSTVIYRDSTDRSPQQLQPQYSPLQLQPQYVQQQQQQQHSPIYAPHQQQMQLVRLVPLGSRRRNHSHHQQQHHHHHLQQQQQQQYFTLQPVSPRETIYSITK